MRTVLALFFIFISTDMLAQQNNVDLDTVTITSPFQPIPISRTGRNITSVPGDYFNKFPVHSIDELLRYLPGVEIQARGPMGSQADIVVRGSSFQQVLIILDGLRLNDPNTGHFNSYIPISPTEIDHIEILKGAASAMYGSEAVGAVIQIITKTFAAKINESKKQFTLQGTGGGYGLWTINAGGLYQNKNTAVAAGVLSNNADGQLQRGTRAFFHNNTGSVSAGHYFNKYWHLSVRSAYDKRKFSAQNFYTTFKSDTARETVQSYWEAVNLTYTKTANTFVLDAGYKKAVDEYAFNNIGIANKNISTLFQFSTRYEHSFTTATNIITGIQFQAKQIKSNDRGNHHLKQMAGFIMLNQAIGKYVTITPAARVDYIENSGTELVPQLNVSYNKQRIQLRGSAGKTIRQADFTERYNNYNKPLVTSGNIGNPDLQAERSFSYEAGFDYFVQRKLKISSSLFKRDQQKLIDWTTTPYSQIPRKENLVPTGNYALAKNIAKVNTTGLETDLQFSASWKHAQQLLLTAGVTWLNDQSSDSITSFYISSHAKLLFNFNIAYTNQWFNISANGLYKTRNAQAAPGINAVITKDYFVLNVKASIYIAKQTAAVFFEANNLFDRKYSDLLGSQMPGRWLMGGFKINFNRKG